MFLISDFLYLYVFVDEKIFRVIQLLGIGVIVFSLVKIEKTINFYGYMHRIFLCYLFYCLSVIFRGITTPMPISFSFLLTDGAYLWHYLLPFLGLIKMKPKYFHSFFLCGCIFIIIIILFCIYNYYDFYFDATFLIGTLKEWDLYYIGRTQISCILLLPFAFLLFYSCKLPFLKKLIFYIAIVLAIGAALMAARRSAAALLILILVLTYITRSIHKDGIISFVKKWMCVVGIVVIALFTYYPKLADEYEKDFQNTFTVLANRGTENTRIGTERDFYKDLNWYDWVVGKGLNGTYYSPEVADLDRPHRYLIETGYLNIILHGGIVLLILYLIILFNSMYNGFCKSHNYISKCSAVYILFNIICLYPSGTPKLNFQYLLLWVCIIICQNNYWRNMDETFFVKYVNFK